MSAFLRTSGLLVVGFGLGIGNLEFIAAGISLLSIYWAEFVD